MNTFYFSSQSTLPTSLPSYPSMPVDSAWPDKWRNSNDKFTLQAAAIVVEGEGRNSVETQG